MTIRGAGSLRGSVPAPPAPPVYIVRYDRETDRYFLGIEGTRQKVAGPFTTSWAALEFARTGLRSWRT
jgi:hypothetical protein